MDYELSLSSRNDGAAERQSWEQVGDKLKSLSCLEGRVWAWLGRLTACRSASAPLTNDRHSHGPNDISAPFSVECASSYSSSPLHSACACSLSISFVHRLSFSSLTPYLSRARSSTHFITTQADNTMANWYVFTRLLDPYQSKFSCKDRLLLSVHCMNWVYPTSYQLLNS